MICWLTTEILNADKICYKTSDDILKIFERLPY